MRQTIENVSQILDSLEKELVAYGAEKLEKRNALLAVEELLLLYRNKLQKDDADVIVDVRREPRIFSVKISIVSEEYSPEFLQEEEQLRIFDNILEHSNFSIEYEYTNSCNHIEIAIKRYAHYLDNLRFAFRYISNKKELAVATATHIISSVANLLIPIVAGQMIVAYTEKVIIQIVFMAGVLLLTKLVYNVFFSIANVKYNKCGYFSAHCIRKSLIERLFLICNSTYEKRGTGTFIQRATTDIDILSGGIINALDICSDAIYYIGVLVATAFLNIWIFLLELLTFGILLIIERQRARRLDIDKRKTYQSDDALNSSVIDCVNGIVELKLMNAGSRFTKKIENLSAENANDAHVLNKNSRLWITAGTCTTTFLFFLLLLYLGYCLKQETITVPTALILYNYFTIIDRPVVDLVQRAIQYVKQFNMASERVRNLFEGSEFEREPYGELHCKELYGDIDVENVTFAYDHDDIEVPDHNILNNLNFHINQGETVALVGRSGCGKSTIFKLLSRQVNCYSGSIHIDGNLLSEFDSNTLYNNMSVINQSPYVFNFSIKENLLIAKPDATMEELRDACRKACILDEIEKTEHGFDTQLGEKGVRFSGGQKQRLAIARALLRNTNILLLDEATSAMDNITQSSIIQAIQNISEKHTILIIAHRLSTIKNADKILVIGNQGVLACGTHEELLKNSEDYRVLYQAENNA